MQLAPGAATIWFAALTRTLRESAPEEPLTPGQQRDPGTEVTLLGREFGAVEGFVQLIPY